MFMRKLIDLDESTFKTLSKLAIDKNTNLKQFIEEELKRIAKIHAKKA